jgi:L-ascorbate metabolism protein UlaG (beta-lactamase superfamily)
MVKRIILGSITILIVVVALYVFFKTRPSGDINRYKDYYVNDSGNPDGSDIKVTFFGVSTLLLDDGETQILIDGFFSRPSIAQALFTKIESDTAQIDRMIAKYKMDRVRGIFVTHSHYDHAFDAAYTTKRTGATLYGSVSTLNIGRGGGLKEDQLSLYEPYREIQLGKFTMQVIPSKHSPGNAQKDDGIIIDKPLAQPAKIKAYAEGGTFDFFIRHNRKSIYIKPSPNYVVGALDSLRADVLFIGIATVTYHPESWQEMYYGQTVGKLKPGLVIPLHWDDFFEPISDNLVMLPRLAGSSEKDFDFFINKTKADKIDFRILQGTRSIILFKE